MNWKPPVLDDPNGIPQGDMPGGRVHIGQRSIAKAQRLFPLLMDQLVPLLDGHSSPRAVISVYGGSGCGKSVMGSLLAYYLNDIGLGTYILAGDNYPHRIPRDNDRERLLIFREYGLKGLVIGGQYTKERNGIVLSLQAQGLDSSPRICEKHPWLVAYQAAGRKGLEGYLGTPGEIDFDEAVRIIGEFKSGAKKMMLKRMGREENETWYDSVNVDGLRILIVEWTHGNSEYLRGVDIPVFLSSSPQETLESRQLRNRDVGCDSSFTEMVLDIEQRVLMRQAATAKIIIAKNGETLSYKSFRSMMGVGQ